MVVIGNLLGVAAVSMKIWQKGLQMQGIVSKFNCEERNT